MAQHQGAALLSEFELLEGAHAEQHLVAFHAGSDQCRHLAQLDIAKLRVGDTLRVSVDAYEGERRGTVSSIEPLGRVMLDTTKFIVKVSFEESSDLLIGMHVRAYWD